MGRRKQKEEFIYCMSKIIQCPNTDCKRYWSKAPMDVPVTCTNDFDFDPKTGKCKWYLPEEE